MKKNKIVIKILAIVVVSVITFMQSENINLDSREDINLTSLLNINVANAEGGCSNYMYWDMYFYPGGAYSCSPRGSWHCCWN